MAQHHRTDRCARHIGVRHLVGHSKVVAEIKKITVRGMFVAVGGAAGIRQKGIAGSRCGWVERGCNDARAFGSGVGGVAVSPGRRPTPEAGPGPEVGLGRTAAGCPNTWTGVLARASRGHGRSTAERDQHAGRSGLPGQGSGFAATERPVALAGRQYGLAAASGTAGPGSGCGLLCPGKDRREPVVCLVFSRAAVIRRWGCSVPLRATIARRVRPGRTGPSRRIHRCRLPAGGCVSPPRRVQGCAR